MAVSVAELLPIQMPASENITRVMNMVGPVVIIMYRICVNNGVPLTDDASIVVSLSGDILSPKYAPEIIAPAVQPSSKPSARPIPSSASPIVATVVHDDPVMTDTTAQIIHEDIRNTAG